MNGYRCEVGLGPPQAQLVEINDERPTQMKRMTSSAADWTVKYKFDPS
jgi:hypothetical protein